MALSELERAKACVDTLSNALRMALQSGGPNALMSVSDVLQVIEMFESGKMDNGAPITGPFFPRGRH